MTSLEIRFGRQVLATGIDSLGVAKATALIEACRIAGDMVGKDSPTYDMLVDSIYHRMAVRDA